MPMLTIDQSYDGRSIDLAVGQAIELRLPENPTTGFSWTVRADGEPACDLAEGPAAPPGTLPGQGREHVWTIRGVDAGTCRIALIYQRSWEATIPPAQEFHIGIRVTQ
jgi:inhibitor of cysteine peptidase